MSTKVSLRAKHVARTRERILSVATALFIQQGFEETTIDQIAEGADVSPRTFFRYFATKEALLFDDLESRLDDMATLIERRPVGEPIAETMAQVFCAMVDSLQSTPELRALMIRLLQERPSLRSYQRSAIADRAHAHILGVLAERVGQDPDSLELRAVVASVAACFDLALELWIEDGAEGPFDVVLFTCIDAVRQGWPQGALTRS